MRHPTHFHRVLSGFKLGAAVAVVALVSSGAPRASAEMNVSGTPDAVTVQAQGSSVDEILTTLGTMFQLHYRSPVKLKRQITGTYGGSLQGVVSRILQDYDVVVKVGRGGLDITVIGDRNPASIAHASASSSGPQAHSPTPASATPVSPPPTVTEARMSAPPKPDSVPPGSDEAQLPASPALAVPTTRSTQASPSAPVPERRSGPAPFPEPTKSDLQPSSPTAAFDGAPAFPAPSDVAIPTPVRTAVAPPG